MHFIFVVGGGNRGVADWPSNALDALPGAENLEEKWFTKKCPSVLAQNVREYSSKKSTTIHTGIIDGNAIKEMAKIVLSIEILPRDTMTAFWYFCPKIIWDKS